MRLALVKAPRGPAVALLENSESLSLGYLAASLRAAGHMVDIHNASLRSQSPSELEGLLLAGDYGLLGFTLPDPGLFEPTRLAIRRLRQCGFDGIVCAGGHTATFHSREILARIPELDAVVLHEGETSLKHLVTALEKGEDWTCVPGVMAHRGQYARSGTESFDHLDLNDCPYPARDDLGWVLENLPQTGAVPVLTSRGCLFRCSFCSVRAFYEHDGKPTLRRRSPENVIDEIDELIETYGVHDILFVDDLFISRAQPDHVYARTLVDAIQKRGIDFQFTISATIDSVAHETFGLLKEAGLRQVFLGAESADTNVLRRLGKWYGPREIRRAVETLNSLGLTSSVSFINFTPFDTLESLRKNARFFSNLGVNFIQGLLNRLQIYGGTPIYRELQAQGKLIGEFPTLDYRGDDELVDVVYEACSQTMKPLLNLANLIKQTERSFNTPQTSRFAVSTVRSDARGVREWGREMVMEAVPRINEEVRELFEIVVDGAERRVLSRKSGMDVELIRDVREEAARLENVWSRVLRSAEAAVNEVRKQAEENGHGQRAIGNDGIAGVGIAGACRKTREGSGFPTGLRPGPLRDSGGFRP